MTDKEKIKKYLVDKLSEVLHLHTENAIVCRNVYQEAITFVDSMDEEHDEIVDKYLYGKEPELVYDGDLPKEESVSEDLEEAVNAYIGYAPEVDECSSVYGKRQAFNAGAKWQKEQMLKGAIEREVKQDAGGYPYIDVTELYDYDKDIPLAKAGDKVKVIIAKED